MMGDTFWHGFSQRNNFSGLCHCYELKDDVLTILLPPVLPGTPLGMQADMDAFMETCSSDKMSCSSGVAKPKVIEGRWGG